jgi:hypothetical protein
MSVAQQIAEQLGKAKRGTDGGWNCLAPCHEDNEPSFWIIDDPEGPGGLRTFCRSGCSGKTRIAALKARGLWPGKTVRLNTNVDMPATTSKAPKRSEPEFVVPVPPSAPLPKKHYKGDYYSKAYEHRDWQGNLITLHCRWDALPNKGKHFKWQSYTKKGWVFMRPPLSAMPNGKLPVYGGHLLQAGEIPVVCEGQKTADAISQVSGYRGLTSGGKGDLLFGDWDPVREAETLIVAPDVGAEDVMLQLAKTYFGGVTNLLMVNNPPDAPNGFDLADADLATRKSLLQSAISINQPKETIVEEEFDTQDDLGMMDENWETQEESWWEELTREDEEPQEAKHTIVVGFDEHLMLDTAMSLLAQQSKPKLYNRHGCLTEVIAATPDCPAKLAAVMPSKLRVLLSRVIHFEGTDGKRRSVPASLPTAIAEWRDYPYFPEIRSLVEHPVMTKDYCILGEPGYDEKSGTLVLCHENRAATIPEKPTQEDAIQAANAILDDFQDFPFEHASDQSAFLAYLLTVFCRDAISGPVPLFILTANDQGAGKSILLEAPWRIATSRAPGIYGGIPRQVDEIDKRILSALISGSRAILFDNVVTKIGGEALAVLVTSGAYRGRRLGSSEDVIVPNNWIVGVSANNATIDQDSATRAYFCKLNAPEGHRDRPEASYKHPNIKAYLNSAKHHIDNALTILASYVAAGMPAMGQRTMRDFHAWTRLVCGSIMYAGLPDPLERQKEHCAESDVESEGYELLLNAIVDSLIMDYNGFTVSKIIDSARNDRRITDALIVCRVMKGDRVDPSAVGRLFRRLKGKPVAGLMLENRPNKNSNASVTWKVVRLRNHVPSPASHQTELPCSNPSFYNNNTIDPAFDEPGW